MTLKGFFAALGATTPSLVSGLVSGWFELFRGTLIMRPAAGAQLEQTAVAVSCLLVIILALLYRSSSSGLHKTMALIFLIVSALFFFAAYWMRTQLGYELPRDTQELFIRFWDVFAWLFIVSVMQTVLFAFMYANGRIKGSTVDL